MLSIHRAGLGMVAAIAEVRLADRCWFGAVFTEASARTGQGYGGPQGLRWALLTSPCRRAMGRATLPG